MKKIGVIGGSGFIGSYIAQQFLYRGYETKVSVTDITRKDKYQHLNTFKNSENLRISELNVEDKEALRIFISDCEIVIHGGTPFILDVQDPQTQLFDPTVKGTENFLEVISESPSIKKVVFIASVAGWNTNFPLPVGNKSFKDTFDESHTRYTSNESHPYAQAKYIANQTVEKYVKDNPNLPFEITTVSPVMVMGKALSQREDSTSGGLQYLIKNKMAPDNFIQFFYDNDVPFAIVDVADVAHAIFLAATTMGLHGKDYLLSSETYKVSDIHLMLNNKEPIEKPIVIYKNALAKRDLKASFRPVKETLNAYST
ncbi:NAD-dependent epimerase/dehydratase family protein [Flavobacteriaceae bacterium F89]|uniref:NAD-dependent epimerase/dehydratase family protein n=1 Tax=Cerina litoralis TaxID=2874477 RepID=A0AAE3JMX9_9FLAO|nr:NAD-dependent epimerase/dehydratase family protein [Cerina litoralis]MCG2459271.1 NAD-dependent epimerase/dehydratase family protein [Cerina litoralis]